jgi:hypothetical protein
MVAVAPASETTIVREPIATSACAGAEPVTVMRSVVAIVQQMTMSRARMSFSVSGPAQGQMFVQAPTAPIERS